MRFKTCTLWSKGLVFDLPGRVKCGFAFLIEIGFEGDEIEALKQA